MKIIYHRLAVRDVREILDHYENEAGAKLGDRFFNDFLATVAKAVSNPAFFPPVGKTMRRANLTDFPYHLLYEVRLWGIRIIVVRHHSRNPLFGMRRR